MFICIENNIIIGIRNIVYILYYICQRTLQINLLFTKVINQYYVNVEYTLVYSNFIEYLLYGYIFFLYVYTRKIYFILFIVFILVYITLLNSLKLFSIKSRVRHTHICNIIKTRYRYTIQVNTLYIVNIYIINIKYTFIKVYTCNIYLCSYIFSQNIIHIYIFFLISNILYYSYI